MAFISINWSATLQVAMLIVALPLPMVMSQSTASVNGTQTESIIQATVSLEASKIMTSVLAVSDIFTTSLPSNSLAPSNTVPSTAAVIITPSVTMDSFDINSLAVSSSVMVDVTPSPTHTVNSSPMNSVVFFSPTPVPSLQDTASATPSAFTMAPTPTAPVRTTAPSMTSFEVIPTSVGMEDASTLVVPTETDEDSSQLPLAGIIGIAIGATVTVVSLSLTVALLICFCCCCIQSKKYEYNTGNEHGMTVQQWNITSAHFNMNRAGSMSSLGSSRSSHSRGSSIFGSFGFTRRYSNSADHVTCIINQPVPDLYSTPV